MQQEPPQTSADKAKMDSEVREAEASLNKWIAIVFYPDLACLKKTPYFTTLG